MRTIVSLILWALLVQLTNACPIHHEGGDGDDSSSVSSFSTADVATDTITGAGVVALASPTSSVTSRHSHTRSGHSRTGSSTGSGSASDSASESVSSTETSSESATFSTSASVTATASLSSTDSVSSGTSTPSSGTASATTTASGNGTDGLSIDSTFLYSLDTMPSSQDSTIDTNTGLALSQSVYIVDMEGSTANDIAAYKSLGKTVMCYLSAGSWEPDRDDAANFDPTCYCGADNVASIGTGCASSTNQLDGWDEWWFDIHDATCLANVQAGISARISAAAEKGCDGIDPDNVDSYENDQNYGTTADDQTNYLLWLSETAKANNLLIDLKNAGDLVTTDIVAAFDMAVIEECHKYNECDLYEPFTSAGKPQIQIEYDSSITSCPSLEPGQNLLVYSGETLNIADITLSCSG